MSADPKEFIAREPDEESIAVARQRLHRAVIAKWDEIFGKAGDFNAQMDQMQIDSALDVSLASPDLATLFGATASPDQLCTALEAAEKAGTVELGPSIYKAWNPDGSIRCDHGPYEGCWVDHEVTATFYVVAPLPKAEQ